MKEWLELPRPEAAAALFGHWQEAILWSCLQGVMGRVCGDDRERPTAAMAALGDFCFLAGAPNRALFACNQRDFVIMVPQNDAWASLVETHYGPQARQVTRYAFRKENDGFDRQALQAMAAGLQEGYRMQAVDEALFLRCRAQDWCRDLVSQYQTYEAYAALGLGVAVLKDGELVAGASSYSSYRGGIEIEIDTREDHRRRGLARSAGAALILRCLERGWHPSWDAQNPGSAALAEQLGYRFSHTYPAYEVTAPCPGSSFVLS